MRYIGIIFGSGCTKELSAIDCLAIMHEVESKNVFFSEEVRWSYLLDNTAVEMKDKTYSSNQNYEVVDVYKFPNS